MCKALRRTSVLAIVALTIGGTCATQAAAQTIAGRRVAVFRAAGFPTVDAPAIAPAILNDALHGYGMSYYAATELGLPSQKPASLLVEPSGHRSGLRIRP